MIARNPSPLRYPGGKVSLTDVLREIIYANGLQGCTYVEPFAGGAGAGLKLLREGHVSRVVINDADRAVFCFWNSVMRRTEELIDLVQTTPLTMREWRRQRDIYRRPGRRSHLEIGFAAFFLNRCNRSGIIKNGGPIGGIEQRGKWKLDARFNRDNLAERISDLSNYGDRITVLRQDASELIRNLGDHAPLDACFVYADPPYYLKGRELYLNHYDDAAHLSFANLMRDEADCPWVITYDDVPRIRELYTTEQIFPFNLRYSVHHSSTSGNEVLIAPEGVTVPRESLARFGEANG